MSESETVNRQEESTEGRSSTGPIPTDGGKESGRSVGVLVGRTG